MLMRVTRVVVGVLLLPLCVGVSMTAAALLRSADPTCVELVPAPVLAMAVGFLLWLLVFFLLPRPTRSYVLAHELTHALWGHLMGADVLGIQVARDSGAVLLSKSNFLVALAPYFFPLYTIMVILAYYILAIFVPLQRYHAFWLGLIGLSWGFHLTFTVTTLLQHQSDIRAHGRLFSYTVIYFLNVLGLCFWIVTVSEATLEQMLERLPEATVATYARVGREVRDATSRLLATAPRPNRTFPGTTQ